jgi:hypothetical protein
LKGREENGQAEASLPSRNGQQPNTSGQELDVKVSALLDTTQDLQQNDFSVPHSALVVAEPPIPVPDFSWDMIELGIDEPLPPADLIDEL